MNASAYAEKNRHFLPANNDWGRSTHIEVAEIIGAIWWVFLRWFLRLTRDENHARLPILRE